MINALFSSRSNGTKDFQYKEISFVWKDIQVVCVYIYILGAHYIFQLCVCVEYVREGV